LSFHQAIERSGPIPADSATRTEKKTYSELLSRELAFEVSEILAPRQVFRNISPRRGVDGPEKYFLGDRRTSTAHRAMRYLRSISGRTAHELSFERFESLTFMLFDPVGSESGRSNLSRCAFEGVENLPQHERPFRLFDPYAGREVEVNGYAEELERQFLVRNPFVDD
jgi:hypothetical protein